MNFTTPFSSSIYYIDMYVAQGRVEWIIEDDPDARLFSAAGYMWVAWRKKKEEKKKYVVNVEAH